MSSYPPPADGIYELCDVEFDTQDQDQFFSFENTQSIPVPPYTSNSAMENRYEPPAYGYGASSTTGYDYNRAPPRASYYGDSPTTSNFSSATPTFSSRHGRDGSTSSFSSSLASSNTSGYHSRMSSASGFGCDLPPPQTMEAPLDPTLPMYMQQQPQQQQQWQLPLPNLTPPAPVHQSRPQRPLQLQLPAYPPPRADIEARLEMVSPMSGRSQHPPRLPSPIQMSPPMYPRDDPRLYSSQHQRPPQHQMTLPGMADRLFPSGREPSATGSRGVSSSWPSTWDSGVHAGSSTQYSERRPRYPGEPGLGEPSSAGPRSAGFERPPSPSDAVLIIRAPAPQDNSQSSDGKVAGASYNPPRRSHLRTVSAPNFPATPATPSTGASHSGRRSTARRPAYEERSHVKESGRGKRSPPPQPTRCMYTRVCRTGAPNRKAISHFFGRNKVCTRSIPDNIWVQWCRQHYQRCRYKAQKLFPQIQCDLIDSQLQRIQTWSDENKRDGNAGVLGQYSLALQKKEKELTETSNEGRRNKKTSMRTRNGEDAEDETEDMARTTVPDWLRNLLGGGHTTDSLRQIFERIKGELRAGWLKEVPNVEMLPALSDVPAPPTPTPVAEYHMPPYDILALYGK